MTNSEKAKEIGITYARQYRHNYGSEELTNSIDECVQSALKMAEWKDQQVKEELNLIEGWFTHIAQIADDKKTANGFVMEDSDAFDEIKCIAKDCAEYIKLGLVTK